MVTHTAHLTAAEFLQLAESNLPTQLLDGEVVMTPSPTLDHQAIVPQVWLLVNRLKPGGRVFVAPLDVKLDETNVVQPDVFWIAPQSSCVPVENRYYQGAPDLVVEVLSPGTARIDKSTKFDLYEKYGVGEYWIVDPGAVYVEVWQRAGSHFARAGVFGPGDSFVSRVLNEQTVPVSDIFSAEK